MWSDIEHMQALEREVAHLRTQLLPHDTGHIHTAISVLEARINEIVYKLDMDLVGFREDLDYKYRMSGGSV